MEWKVGDKFIIVDPIGLPSDFKDMVCTVTATTGSFGFIDLEDSVIYFEGESLYDYYIPCSCIRPLTKLEKALK